MELLQFGDSASGIGDKSARAVSPLATLLSPDVWPSGAGDRRYYAWKGWLEMSAIYAATYTGTITNAGGNVDLGSFSPADDSPIRLRGFLLSQISEVGDAAEEGLEIVVKRMPATMTVGSGGSAITATKPLADFKGGSTWAMTARANDTTIATSSGTVETLHEAGWNERNSPYDFFWPDERFCITIGQSGANLTGIVMTQNTTAADDYTGAFTFWVEELN